MRKRVTLTNHDLHVLELVLSTMLQQIAASTYLGPTGALAETLTTEAIQKLREKLSD